MTKTKTIAAVLAAITLATALTAPSAQARPRFGLGVGLAAGAIVGAAPASTYGGPVYVYRECHYVHRYDAWGNLYVTKVCDY